MRAKSRIKFIAAIIVAAFICTSFPVTALAGDEKDDPLYTKWLMARKNKGPILWYVRDEEKKKAMESDMELFRKYNEAMKAKNRRKKISSALFYPGASIMAVGVFAGMFQNTLGLYDETTGTQIMISGLAIGGALVIPGIVVRSKKSKKEKEYLEYVKEKYEIMPILKKDPDGDTFYAMGLKYSF